MAEIKKHLRDNMRARRNDLSAPERQALSQRASALMLACPEWNTASVVALYMAVRGEITCDLLLESAWQSGKEVLLPLCSRANEGEMRLVACHGRGSLRPGSYGIPEPIAQTDCADIPDLIVLPGLAFDLRGNRLGMGGGYYDRLLAKPGYERCFTVGFAYSFQLLDGLPAADHDRPVRALCTDNNFIRVRNE